MAKPLLIAIGVSRAKSMPVLEGVLKSIDDLTGWAKRNGYDVVAIDDRKKTVTVERIRKALTPTKAGVPSSEFLLDRPRIVVYFCGHGLSSWPDQYWVLSPGPDQTRDRISADAFRDTLATYGPDQIAMVSDACRTAWPVIGAGDPVIDRYAGAATSPQKDRFYSSRDGDTSFAVPANGKQPAFCVFSDTLLRGLSQPDGSNLDQLYAQLGRRVVTSQSLADYLEANVPRAALAVDRLQDPQCDPGFRPPSNGYIDFDDEFYHGTHAPPAPPAEPTAEAFTELTSRRAQRGQEARVNRSRSEWRAPFARTVDETVRGQPPLGNGPVLLVGPDPLAMIAPAAADIAYMPASDVATTEGTGRWFTSPPWGEHRRSVPVLARSGELSCTVPAFPDLWCALVFNAGTGVELLSWGDRDEPDTGVLHATEALKGLTTGSLTSSDTVAFAENLRLGKHMNPLLGVVSAYLYGGVGDVDSIRRICYYYHEHDQDVPFDIAMLADVPLEPAAGGGFSIVVPEVGAAPPFVRPPGAPEYTWIGTPSVRVGVAGVTPILRAGWARLSRSPHRVHRQCWELVDHLTQAPVATFAGLEVGEQLEAILRGA